MLSLFRKRLERTVTKISICNFFRTCTKMDMECDDILYYSHQKFQNLLNEKGENRKYEAVEEYFKSLKYQPVRDFPPGLEWFNVSEPLSFKKHLKGKIVVLDFFTYCCINCMHIIPDLRAIEKQFSVEDGLVVVGVHSAKFENEKVSQNILAAVQRYNIAHPVVNDYKCEMWKNCEVSCWPTLLILGPNANPIVMLMGEGHRENLEIFIQHALRYYKEKNEISDHKIPFKSAYHFLPDLKGPLLFPGKITSIASQDGKEMLAVSDTGNNRILIMNEEGSILKEIGGERAGFQDGSFDEALFNAPQGLTFKDESTLFVADTENHAIRRIDLKKETVERIVGTLKQGNDRVGGKRWKEQEISSPWDVCIYRIPDMDMTFYPDRNPPLREVLLIAMAGLHQIWALFLDDTIWWKGKKYPAGTCVAIAGSGREENRNNQYPQNAGFAQPSGLALCAKNKEVYIADSESSSVRRLSLADGKVSAVVGGDRNPANLFAFGDKDGLLNDAKLQHLLGLAASPDETTIFVADTYNHKIKKVDVTKNTITTLAGSDTTDGALQNSFNEPGGLCVSSDGRKLYVADTNNHKIKVIALSDSDRISSVLELNLKLKSKEKKPLHNEKQSFQTKIIGINDKGGKVILNVSVGTTDGLKIDKNMPFNKWQVYLPDATWSCAPSSGSDSDNMTAVISVPPKISQEPNVIIDFVFKVATCGAYVCKTNDFMVEVPIAYAESNPTCAQLEMNFRIDPSGVKIV